MYYIDVYVDVDVCMCVCVCVFVCVCVCISTVSFRGNFHCSSTTTTTNIFVPCRTEQRTDKPLVSKFRTGCTLIQRIHTLLRKCDSEEL
jgi:hypothetical protein